MQQDTITVLSDAVLFGAGFLALGFGLGLAAAVHLVGAYLKQEREEREAELRTSTTERF